MFENLVHVKRKFSHRLCFSSAVLQGLCSRGYYESNNKLTLNF